MLRYIDQNLLPEERILFRTKKHVIVFFLPLVWTGVALYLYKVMGQNPFLVRFTWVPLLLAALFWGVQWLEYITADFAVTNKRIMMREGFFIRHTNETRLATVSQVTVEQSLLGQLLNYGMVAINTFGGVDAFSLIVAPFTFQKYVNEQLDKIVR